MFYIIVTFWAITAWILFALGNAYPEYLKIVQTNEPLAAFLAFYWLIGNYVCGLICCYRLGHTETFKDYFGLDKPLKCYWARHLYKVYKKVE